MKQTRNATGDDGKPSKDAPTASIDEYVEALKKGGVEPEVAQDILKRWQEVGADADPSTLRQMFLKQSLVPVAAVVVQLLFDAGAAYSILTSSAYFSIGPEFTGQSVLVAVLALLSGYFALGVVFDLATLVAILVTTAKLGTNPDAFYKAVKKIAGTSQVSALALADKANTAANAVKVAQALDAILKLLDTVEEQGAAARSATLARNGSIDTLQNLGALLTLSRSETKESFDPTAAGMNEEEAAEIAAVFSQYDLNDDGRLDVSEVRKMIEGLGLSGIGDAEAAAAIQVMDTNKDGFVNFSEFAQWYGAKKGLKPLKA